MPNAANKVHSFFKSSDKPLTLHEIKTATELRANEVSMALCHLRKQGYLTRELAKNTIGNRKQVWEYIYHSDRSAKETA